MWQFPLLDQSGRRDAMINYRLALKLDPENAHANNNLAWALISVPGDPWFDPAQGLALAQKAVALEPNEWAFLNTLGVAAFRSGTGKPRPRSFRNRSPSQAAGPMTCSSWR